MKAFFVSVLNQLKAKIVESIAVLVAALSLWVSIEQGNTQKEIALMEKRPFLIIEHHRVDFEAMNGLILKNQGNGAAIIESFKIFRNAEDTVGSETWLPHVENQLGFIFEKINYLSKGYLIPGKGSEDIYLLGTTSNVIINGSGEQPGQYYGSATAQAIGQMRVEIEYRSFYDDLDKRTYVVSFSEGRENLPSNYREVIED